MTIMSARLAAGMSVRRLSRGARRGRVRRLSGSARDVRLRRTVARLSQELAEARNAATHDPLTGLLNRAGLNQAWPTLTPTGLLLIDLDGFKPVNDRFGHLAGDLVLTAIAARLSEAASIVARLGGDEFVVVTADPDPTGLARTVADVISAPIVLPDTDAVAVTASVGVYPTASPIVLGQALELADRAMYAAKRATSSVVVFDPAVHRDVTTAGRRRDVHPAPSAVAR